MMRRLTIAFAMLLSACTTGQGSQAMSHFSVDAFATASAQDFIRAVMSGDVTRAIPLARLAPNGVNTLGNSGETALLVAVDRGDLAMVQALLAAGANPDGGPNRTPLHPATREKALRILPLLLQAKADPNRPYDDESALYEAALIGSVPAAKLLLEHGAKVELGNAIGATPATTAASADHWEMVHFLMSHGASIWQAEPSGFTIATFAEDSRVRRDTPDGQALEAVVQSLRSAGYPWPPPGPPEVRKLIEQGRWPPRPH